MELLLLIVSKYLLGFILQSLSCILAVYAFNKEKIQLKMFSILALIFAISIFIIRNLPITPGVHTVLLLIVLSIIGVFVLKVPIRNTIFAVLYVGICISVSELIMTLLLGLFIGFDKEVMKAFLENDLNFAVSGIPTTLMFLAVTLIIYITKTKDKSTKRIV